MESGRWLDLRNLKIRNSKEPLYEVVARRLREEIEDGVFSDESRLPSEEEMAKLFGVSRPTVREALSALEKQGYLRRVHGVGTWINHNARMPIGTGMERIISCTDYIRMFGYEPGTKMTHFEWVAATAKHVQDFGRPLDKVGVLTRVRTADSEPLLVCYDIMPPEIIGEDFAPEEMGESLFDYLKAKGVVLGSSEVSITATISDQILAEKLDVEVGVPLLLIDDLYFDPRGEVILVTRNIYRVDRWVIKLYRN